MTTKSVLITGFLSIFLFVLTSANTDQDTTTFIGIYDGYEDYGYNFIETSDDGDDYTMTLQHLDKSLLKSFDLNSEKLIGTKFSVTYTTETEIEKDEDGYEDEVEVYTIIALKKL
ncbi:hypothetical protein [Psychroserpens damuponensis]|uniref:hypothetical protein n=1 Tax=Psychroserpens damuponensis TaxID=943936 RepID=UPI00058F006E|nr:hypothetical protein [Psychroserpens damuponensis]